MQISATASSTSGPLKLGVQGWIVSDLSDVVPEVIQPVVDMGFMGMTAHLNVTADQVDQAIARRAAEVVRGHGLEFLQLWGRYSSVITEHEEERNAGLKQAAGLIRLAADMGVRAVGMRPTSRNPAGHWRAHRDHFTTEIEEVFLESYHHLGSIAEEEGVELVFEFHVSTLLDSPGRIRRLLEQLNPGTFKVNLDPVNLIGDLRMATHSTPVVNEMFDLLGEYGAVVHMKDYTLENRHLVHIAEAPTCTAMLDTDTVLRRSAEIGAWLVIEHLPRKAIPSAAIRLRERIGQLGLPVAPPLERSLPVGG